MSASVTFPDGNAMPNKYAEELVQTARAIVAPGKGILAADESTGTVGKRVRDGVGFVTIIINVMMITIFVPFCFFSLP